MKPFNWAISISIAVASSISGVLMPQLGLEALPAVPVAEDSTETTSSFLPSEISAAIVTLQGAGGKGTGTIIDPNGMVLTSEHIITEAQGGQVSILTQDGHQYPGKVVATDSDRDLALIQILSHQTFPTIPLANGDKLRTGTIVYALDDPFRSLENFTVGKLKKITESTNLYTDILLSPGDSGGPLLNDQGEIIGVNRAIIRFQSTDQQTTWGLAVHIHSVHQFLEQSQSQEHSAVQRRERGKNLRLGITVIPNTLEIIKVEPNSLADQWGLRPGDKLVGYNYHLLDNLATFQEFLETNPSEVLLFVRRNDYLVRLRMRL